MEKGFKWSYFYIFFIISFSYCVLFICSQIYPFGQGTLVISDLQACYVPQICELKKCLLEGKSILHTWNRMDGSTPLGMANIGMLFQLGNFIFMLVPDKYIPIVMNFYIPVKTCFIGFAMYFLLNHMEVKSSESVKVIISVIYALGPFTATYFFLIIWTDQLIVLPLLVYSIMRWIQDNRKWKLFWGVLSYSFLANFYISYMIVVFLFLYFNLILIPNTSFKDRIKYSLSYFMIHLAALLVSFPILLASFKPIIMSPNLSIKKFCNEAFTSPVLTLLMKMVTTFYDGILGSNTSPFIFIGVTSLVVILVLFRYSMFYNRNLFILWCFLLLSILFKPLYGFWHAFDLPDGFPCRFTFILTFTTCVILYRTLADEDGLIDILTDSKEGRVVSMRTMLLSLFIFTVLSIQWFRLYTKGVDSEFFSIIVLPFIFLLLISLIVNYSIRHIKYVLFLEYFVAFSIISSATYTTYSSISINEYEKEYKELSNALKSYNTKGDFKRLYVLNSSDVPNLSIQYSYPGISSFNNIKNYNTVETLNYFQSEYVVGNMVPITGMTPVQKLLFNVQYKVEDGKLEALNTPTALGYVIPKSIPQIEDVSDMDFAKYQNYICSQILGTDEKMFLPNSPIIEEDKLTGVSDSWLRYVFKLEKNKEYYLTMSETKDTQGLSGGQIEVDGENYFRKKNNLLIKEVEEDKSGVEVIIRNRHAVEVKDKLVKMYYLNDSLYQRFKDYLLQNKFTITYIDDLTLDGEFTSEKDGILYLSIPYDTYSIYVDGKVVSAIESLPGFLGIPVKRGTHDVHIRYRYL